MSDVAVRASMHLCACVLSLCVINVCVCAGVMCMCVYMCVCVNVCLKGISLLSSVLKAVKGSNYLLAEWKWDLMAS